MIKHIAIIPDGNRRWARAHNVSLAEAYRVGVEKIREVVRHISEHGIAKYVTFYVLSVENIVGRSEEELAILYALLISELRRTREDPDTYRYGIRIRVIGLREVLPAEVQEEIRLTEEATRENTGCVVNLAVAYGGLYEPFHMLYLRLREQGYSAVFNKLAESEDVIYREFTYFGADTPPPDVVIRTGGEVRISNFLLPHIVGARLVFLKKYWPDVTPEDIDYAVSLVEKKRSHAIHS